MCVEGFVLHTGLYDYVPEVHAITFGPSRDGKQCRSIEILNDELMEGKEMFWAVLTTNYPLLDLPDNVPVIIQDNSNTDGMIPILVWSV